MFELAVGTSHEIASSQGGITLWRCDCATVLVFHPQDEAPWHMALEPRRAYLIVTGRGRFHCQEGRAAGVSIDRPRLSCLLAFVDAPQAQYASGRREPAPRILIPLPCLSLCEPVALQHWLIASALRGSVDIAPLLTFLRQQESYSLVRFLDRRATVCASIAELGMEYGVSYSHFRRLGRQALGVGVKSAFKRWRAVRALLRVAEVGADFTAAALDSGYCSSSQFSTEVRSLFGRPPRFLLAPRF